MKIAIIYLALATALFGQAGDHLTFKGTAVDTRWAPTSLHLAAGTGFIKIDLKTGQVDLPKDMTLPDAAVAFWLRVAQAFPECRQAMLTGDPTPKTTEWMETNNAFLSFNGRRIDVGLRSDGVVVWREVKR